MKVEGQQSLSEGRAALAKMMTAQWVIEHGKQLGYGAFAIAALLFLLLSWSKRFSGSSSDYLKAEVAFSTWAAQDKHDLALFKEVNDPLKRHPELAAKFGTLIAQRLLALGEAKLAQDYAQAALQRTKALLCPHHALFSQNTLLISQGRLQEALQGAYALKEKMAGDASNTLFAYNLLRIAALERETGAFDKEMAAWEEVLNCGAFAQLSGNFQSGDVSLSDYIKQRQSFILSCVGR